MNTTNRYELIGGFMQDIPEDESSSSIDSPYFLEAKRIADMLICNVKTKQLIRIIKNMGPVMRNYMNSPVIDFLYEHLEFSDKWVELAIRYDNFDALRFLCKCNINKSDYNRVLRLAASYNDLNVVKFLHESGVDIHNNNESVLYFAIKNDSIDVIKYLVKNNADVNVKFDKKYTCSSPLGAAIGYGYLKTLKWLIRNGARITIECIDTALTNNDPLDILKYLMSRGAKIMERYFYIRDRCMIYGSVYRAIWVNISYIAKKYITQEHQKLNNNANNNHR